MDDNINIDDHGAPNTTLSIFLGEEDLLPPPSKSPEECIVGPTSEEREEGAPYWGRGRSSSFSTAVGDDGGGRYNNNKRKRDDEIALAGTTQNNSNSSYKKASAKCSSSFEHGIATFLSSGCCMIPNVLPKSYVLDCHRKAASDLEFLQKEREIRLREAINANSQHLLAAVQRGDFREFVERDGGRIDIRFQCDRFPFTNNGLIYNPIVYPFVKEMLGGGDINLLYAGIMWATPQTEPEKSIPQKWHGDGGHLFQHTHLPPHCINVFYPLVDLKTDNGTTEFKPGTHRLGHFNDNNVAEFGFACEAGSAILFDYRLKHRGGVNTTKEPRPVLYLAYAKTFFRDAGNLRSGRSLVINNKNKPSPPWVARILTGKPMEMGKGFEKNNSTSNTTEPKFDNGNKNNDKTTNNKFHNDDDHDDVPPSTASTTEPDNNGGSGERWVLFRMNVELTDGEPRTLVVYHGDVATEVSEQFCIANKLDDQFISVLADTIQQQMDACK